jgi:hypothetical protein
MARLEIFLPVGIGPFAQPIEESVECSCIECPILLQVCHGDRKFFLSSAAILHSLLDTPQGRNEDLAV